jgi:NADH dehydrogenase
VVLLDRHNFHTFYPLLYQIGAAEIAATEICYPVRKVLRGHDNVRFVMAEVEELDLEGRRLRAGEEEFAYDHLILATGSDSDYFGVEGAEEHAFPLKEVEEGIALRNHVLSRFERAARTRDPELRGRLLTFAIVGGGPTGVEYAGALSELVHGPLARDYPEVDAGEVSILLLEARDGLLGGMEEELGRYAHRRLEEMEVDVRLGAMVERVEENAVHLSGGGCVETETVVWTAGVQGDPDARRWGLPTVGPGRVRVEPTLQVPGHPEVQVVGDLAGLEEDGALLPQVAPAATQQGEHAAGNILRLVRGEEAEPFRYRDKGMLATVGRNHAVAEVFGRAFTGFAAWFLWVVVHIAKLIGFRNRLVVLTNWAWDYFTYERYVRLILPLGGTTETGSARGRLDLPAPEGTEVGVPEGVGATRTGTGGS